MTKDGGPKEWDLGWYPDPDRPGQERFWNGAEWTQRRAATEATGAPPATSVERAKRSTIWLVVVAVAVVVVVAFVLGVVVLDGADSPIQEDDEAEFREVTITDCAAPGAFTAQEVRGVATNGSSERSDYHIEVAVLSADATRIGTGSTDVRDVEPGQRALWSIDTDTAEQDWDPGSTCAVTSVERTASF